MALKRREIEEGDLFGGIKQSAKEAKPEVDALKEGVVSITGSIKSAREESEKGTFDAISDSANQAVSDVTVLETKLKVIKGIAKNLKGAILKSDPQTSKGLRDHNALVDKSNALAARKIDIDKKKVQLEKEVVRLLSEEERLQQQKNKTDIEAERLTQAKIRTKERELALSVKQKKEEERLEKIRKKEEARIKKENSLRAQQARKIRELSDEYRELIILKGGETKESRRLLKQVLALKKARDGANEALGNHQHKVGRYERALRGLTGTLAKLGLGFGVFEILRNSLSTLADYDEKIADIQKTTGLASKDARLLSIELLNIDTRSSVTELQELASAAGRLGIAEEDIVGFVRSADKAFVALGDDLGGTAEEIATNLGKIAANFGLIEEFGVEGAMERVGSVMNELAANSKAGAAGIFEFTNRLAGIASVAGISQQDVQALGALFDSTGQSIEVAASTLAKLLPALSSDQKRFAEVAGLTAEEFAGILKNSPVEALKAVAEGAKSSEGGLNGLVSTLEDFGIESARAAGIVGVLAENTDELTELQRIANEAFAENNSLSDEFDTKNQTVNASVSKLKKSWEALIIKWNEGSGLGSKLIGVINFLAKNLEKIVKVIFGGLRAWALQKLAVSLFRTEIDKTGKSISVGLIPNLIKMGKSLISSVKGFKAGSLSARAFGNSLKSIPFVGIISGLFSIVGLFMDMGEEVDNTADEVERLKIESTGLNRVNEETEKRLNEEAASLRNVFDRLKATTFGTKERKEALDEVNRDYGITLKNLKDEGEFVRQLDVSYANLIARMEKKIRFQLVEEEVNKLLVRKIELENKIKDNEFARQKAEEARIEQKERILEIEKEISELQSEFSFSGNPEVDQRNNQKRELRIAELKEELSILKDLDSIEDTDTKAIEVIDQRIRRLRNSLGELNLIDFNPSGGSSNSSGSSQRFKTEREILDKRFKDLIAQNKVNLIAVEKQLRDQGKTEIEIAKGVSEAKVENLKKEADFALKNYGEYSEEYIKANVMLNRELAKLNKNRSKNDDDYFSDLVKQNKENQIILETNLIASGASREKIEKELIDSRIDQLKNEIEVAKRLNIDSNDLELELARLQSKKLEEIEKARNESAKENAERRNDIIESSTDRYLKFADRRIEKINEEIAAAQRQADVYQELAANGNIEAKQSLAEQNQIIAEAEAQKAKIERQKQSIQLVSSVLKAYNNALGEGKSAPEALQEAFTGAAAIEAFIGAIPAFMDGIEDTGRNGYGIDGKGGFISILHPNERVMTKEHNAMIGDYSNDEVAKVMYAYRRSEIPLTVKASENIDFKSLEDRLDGIYNVIDKKPEYDVEIGKISSMAMSITETKKQGNRKTSSKYIVKNS